MIAISLLIKKFLGLIPWWAWPVLALMGWGSWEHHQVNSLHSQLNQEHADQKASQLASEEIGRILKMEAARLKGIRDEQDKRTATRLDLALRELRNRPDRLPAAATEACKGATGAGLSRPDAGFLVGEAARANQLRSELAEWQSWGDKVSARCQIATP